MARRLTPDQRVARDAARAFGRNARALTRVNAKQARLDQRNAQRDLIKLQKLLAANKTAGGVTSNKQKYRLRILRNLAKGKSRQEARGHKKGQEYAQRKASIAKRYPGQTPSTIAQRRKAIKKARKRGETGEAFFYHFGL